MCVSTPDSGGMQATADDCISVYVVERHGDGEIDMHDEINVSALLPVEYHSLIAFFHVHVYCTVEHYRMQFMLHGKVIYMCS